MPTDLFDLATKLSVSTTQHDAALTASGVKVHALAAEHKAAEGASNKLSEGFRALASSAVIVDGPLGGVASRLRAVGAEAGELSSVFGDAGPFAIAIGGIIAVAGALSLALFELAHKSGEAGKSILEISEKTNLSTEAISAFRVAADLSGTTIAAVGNKLGGFNVAMGQAQNGNKAMVAEFQKFGGAAGTTEEVLSRFLKKFEEMGPTAQRNALEAKIFRDRTGELIPLLERLGGSLDEAEARAKALGLSFSEDGAKQAKDFEDRLKLLGLGAEGLANQIGSRLIPVIEGALSDLSAALGSNESSWASWGATIGDVMARAVNTVRSHVANISAAISSIPSAIGAAYVSGNPLDFLRTQANAVTDAQKRMGLQFFKESVTGGMGDRTSIAGPSGSGGKGKHGADPAKAEFQMEQERTREVIALFKSELDAHDLALKKRETSLEEFTSAAVALEIKRSNATIAELNLELAAAERIKKPETRALDVLKVQDKINDEKRRSAKAISDDIQKLDDDQLARAKVRDEMFLSIAQKGGEGQKALVSNLMAFKILTEQKGEQQLGAIELAAMDRQAAFLDGQLDLAGKDAAKKQDIQKQLAELEIDRANLFDDVQRRIKAGRDKDLTEQRAYTDQLRALNAGVAAQALDAARARVSAMGAFGSLTPGQAATAIKLIDVKSEDLRFAQVRADLLSQVDTLNQKLSAIREAAGEHDATVITIQTKAQIDALNHELESSEKIHQAKMLEIQLASLAEMKARFEQGFKLLTTGFDEIFTKGWKAAFKDTLIGFLDMIKQMELQLLESKLLAMLQGNGSSSGGGGFGGFLKLLLGIGAAGLSQGSIGSGTLAPAHTFTPHATGLPFVPFDNYPALLHKGEAVIPASQNTGMGGHTFVFNISSPNPQSFMSWETQSQITSRMKNALQRVSRN